MENAEFSRWLFAQSCEFSTAADNPEDLPELDLPEIAFAGRSNVGKSSLINTLLNRKNLARTSNTPGRTQQLNFFALSDKCYIVDMPGYGYAAVSKTKLKVFSQLIQNYLKGRVQLRRVFLLIDSRHGFKPPDLTVMEMLDKAAVAYQVVLTKADKTPAPELENLLSDLETALKKHPAAFPTPIVTSSVKGEGLSALRETIAEIISETRAE